MASYDVTGRPNLRKDFKDLSEFIPKESQVSRFYCDGVGPLVASFTKKALAKIKLTDSKNKII